MLYSDRAISGALCLVLGVNVHLAVMLHLLSLRVMRLHSFGPKCIDVLRPRLNND